MYNATLQKSNRAHIREWINRSLKIEICRIFQKTQQISDKSVKQFCCYIHLTKTDANEIFCRNEKSEFKKNITQTKQKL